MVGGGCSAFESRQGGALREVWRLSTLACRKPTPRRTILPQRIWFELPSIAFVSGLVFGLRPAFDLGALYLFGGIIALYLLLWAVRSDSLAVRPPREERRTFRFLHHPRA
jgi:hypothetical protein